MGELSLDSTLERIAKETLVPPVKNGPKISLWPEWEVNIINNAIVAGKTDEEIKDIVEELIKRRTM